MGSQFRWTNNPFHDFLLQSIMQDIDISDKKYKADIYTSFVYILQNVLENKNDAVYLDFEIINNNNKFKIVGKNAISAIWLSGEFSGDSETMLKNNVFIIGDRKYKFNKKTKELTYTLINE